MEEEWGRFDFFIWIIIRLNWKVVSREEDKVFIFHILL